MLLRNYKVLVGMGKSTWHDTLKHLGQTGLNYTMEHELATTEVAREQCISVGQQVYKI